MRPKEPPRQWEEFLQNTEPYAIALDGYVCDSTRFDSDKHIANFNHHENCDRLATNATCGQILMAARMGLFDSFRKDTQVFVNDCDEDVCLSLFLLKHNWWSEQTLNPSLNKLVNVCDSLDRTGGFYPMPKNLPLLKEIAWIFEPYRRSRQSGSLYKKDTSEYLGIVEDVENRILRHLTGSGKQLELDCSYNVVGQGKGWSLVEESGSQARMGLACDGIKAFVSVKQRPDGSWQYTIAKSSPFISFPVSDIFKLLNKIENLQDSKDQWGGGDTIGGSPRVKGSTLNPEQITKAINEFLNG